MAAATLADAGAGSIDDAAASADISTEIREAARRKLRGTARPADMRVLAEIIEASAAPAHVERARGSLGSR